CARTQHADEGPVAFDGRVAGIADVTRHDAGGVCSADEAGGAILPNVTGHAFRRGKLAAWGIEGAVADQVSTAVAASPALPATGRAAPVEAVDLPFANRQDAQLEADAGMALAARRDASLLDTAEALLAGREEIAGRTRREAPQLD